MVGLLPLCAVTVFDGRALGSAPGVEASLSEVRRGAPGADGLHPRSDSSSATRDAGSARSWTKTKLRRVLAKMLDEKEFLSPYGIRSLSRYHAEHPYVFQVGGQEYRRVLPAGGVRYRHVRRQLQLARADLDAGQRPDHPGPAAVLHCTTATTSPIECPTGSGRQMNLYEVAEEIARRLASIFLRDKHGRRPVYGAAGSSRRIRTGATTSCSTSTSTATTEPVSARATRPDGPGSSPGPCMSSRPPRPSRPSSSARRPLSWKSSRRKIGRPKARLAATRVDMGQPLYPSLYQINTRVWLTELSRSLGRPATLDDVPDAELDRAGRDGI